MTQRFSGRPSPVAVFRSFFRDHRNCRSRIFITHPSLILMLLAGNMMGGGRRRGGWGGGGGSAAVDLAEVGVLAVAEDSPAAEAPADHGNDTTTIAPQHRHSSSEGCHRQGGTRTSGEIVVSVAPIFWGSVEKAAQKGVCPARRHSNEGTQWRYDFCRARQKEIHACSVTAEFTPKSVRNSGSPLRRKLSEHFRKGDFTEGLVRAVEVIGEKLAIHFPYDACHRCESAFRRRRFRIGIRRTD